MQQFPYHVAYLDNVSGRESASDQCCSTGVSDTEDSAYVAKMGGSTLPIREYTYPAATCRAHLGAKHVFQLRERTSRNGISAFIHFQ